MSMVILESMYRLVILESNHKSQNGIIINKLNDKLNIFIIDNCYEIILTNF
jgi:hypothetical protein